MFRSLRDAEGNALTHNFRPIQPLNERIVLANSPHSDEPEYQPKFVDDPTPLPTFSFPTSPSMEPSSANPPNATTDHIMGPTTTADTLVFSTQAVNEPPPPTIPTPEETKEKSTMTYNSVEPLSTTLPTAKTTTNTVGKIAFPEAITELPNNKLEEEVVTHKTHKQDHLKQGKSGQSRLHVQSITLLVTSIFLFSL